MKSKRKTLNGGSSSRKNIRKQRGGNLPAFEENVSYFIDDVKAYTQIKMGTVKLYGETSTQYSQYDKVSAVDIRRKSRYDCRFEGKTNNGDKYIEILLTPKSIFNSRQTLEINNIDINNSFNLEY